MAVEVKYIVLVTLGIFAGWQFLRISQFDKDVYFHHSEDCTRVEVGSRLLDFTRFGDVTLAVANSENQSSGQLLAVHKLASGKPTFDPISIENVPSGFQFRPLGFHLHNNATLFIINQVKDETEIVVVNVTEKEKGKVTGKYVGKIGVPEDLQGKVTDLIAYEKNELYLAQTYAVGQTDFLCLVHRGLQFGYELLDAQSTYIQHCTYDLGSTAVCAALNNTEGVSVTGITVDRFDTFYASYASIDENWYGVYERKASNGDLILKQKVPVRDRIEHIDADSLYQKTFCGGNPYPYSGTGGNVPGAAVELTAWDHRAYRTYRTLVMHDGSMLKGGSCAARQGKNVMLGSKLDTAVLVCPIAASFI